MKRIMLSLMILCAVMMAQAQALTIRVNQKFWDGYSLYTVKEVRIGKIVYMTARQGEELTLEKVAGKQGEYKIIPSRQADDCPFGAQYGWRVQHVRQDGKIDITLQPTGRQHTLDFAEVLLRYLYENDGRCDLGDKSDAELIYDRFKVSKKAYKKAIGDLYRRRLIIIEEEGIRLA